ncbi:MAG: hypothetical protein COT43_01485, partial [Candidatus Marinimicrobia bacterium CG08_land_8_20_14_0_20_45_22]
LFFIFNFSLLYADWASHIVISELATTGSGSTANEIIEIYNPTDSPVDISKLRIQYLATTGSSYNTKLYMNELAGTIVMQPYTYFLFCPADAPDPSIADRTWSSYFHMADRCTIRITLDSSGENFTDPYEDKVAIGDTAQDGEGGSYAPSISGTADDRSIERKASAASDAASMESGADEYEGNGWDSDDNSADFIIRTSRNPQNSSSDPEPQPPPTPTGFAVADILNDGTLKISWTPDDYTTGTYAHFKIYRGLSEGNEEAYTQTLSSTTHEYWDAVAAGVTYYYRVSAMSTGARNNESVLTYSENAFATDNTAPELPTNLTANNTSYGANAGNRIALMWTPSVSDDICLYKIGYKNSFFQTWDTFGVSTYTISAWISSEKSSWTIVSNLTDNVTYFFRLSAIDNNLNESVLSSTITAYPSDIKAPDSVSINNIVNEGSGKALILYWTSYSPEDDVVGYKIWYNEASFSNTGTANLWAIVSGKDNKTKTITGLTEGTTYWFAITAFDEVPNEKTDVSGWTVFSYPSDDPPSQITTLAAANEETGGKINLSWTASSESDVAGYNIYRA